MLVCLLPFQLNKGKRYIKEQTRKILFKVNIEISML